MGCPKFCQSRPFPSLTLLVRLTDKPLQFANPPIRFQRDFEFSMRIPESVPPTIELENKSGIHYELIATVCTKGKKYVSSSSQL